MSTNIRFENPADGLNNWPNRKRHLSSVVTHCHPDLIGSQEGRQKQLKEFEKQLRHYQIIDSHRPWIVERMYPTIFSNNRFQCKESGDIWLSKTPYLPGSKDFESAFPRLATYALLSDSNFEFIYINLHLDHERDTTRKAQIKVLIDQIALKWENIPMVIGGDFNQSANGEVKKLLISHFPSLYDPWKWPEETTYHKFQGHLLTGSRIDWFVVDKTFKTLEYKILKDNNKGQYPSDHFPIQITLEV